MGKLIEFKKRGSNLEKPDFDVVRIGEGLISVKIPRFKIPARIVQLEEFKRQKMLQDSSE